MKASWRLATAGLAMVLAGCAAAPTAMQDAGDLENLDKDEERLWAMSDEISDGLEKSRAIEFDRQSMLYLQSLMNELFPEFRQAIRVFIIKNPEANAFAMANGHVYVHTGMLARLRNEAELAAVLGHEGAHFTERHVLERMRNAKNMSVFANVMGSFTGLGGALASSVIAASSMSGLSQANESEADAIGLARMSRLGYDPRAAAKPFERLAQELKARDINEPRMFRSHPKLAARAASLSDMAEDFPGVEIGEQTYLDNVGHIRLAALEQAVEMNQGELLVFLLSTPDQMQSYNGQAQFYLAEGYRLRADEGDEALAVAAYQAAIEAGNQAARAHGKLGYIAMRAGDNEAAISHFEESLVLDPESPDSAYLASYLKKLKGDNND
ncbi:MAG: M48 family metalloprotease [Pseudomonadota bacterium]